MHRVTIYIETDSACPRKMPRQTAAIIECETVKGPAQIGMFRETETTYQRAMLQALIGALEKLNQTCEIEVCMGDGFIENSVKLHLPVWRMHEFKNSKGEDIKNREEWGQLTQLLDRHLLTFTIGRHTYTDWMIREMDKRKNETEKI